MFVIDDSMINNKNYNGNTRKFGITYNGVEYIVKFPKGNDLSVYCEYICSRLIKNLGYNCHSVNLGVYKGILVDIIKDFTFGGNYALHSFKDTKQSSEDTEIGVKEYTYDDILYLIDKHLKINDKDKYSIKCSFWDMFICDAIIGNRDRHWGNWGYILVNGSYKFAPLYDNGAGLYPNVNKSISEYVNIGTRKKFLYDRVFVFPASLFKMKRKDRAYRTNYYDMFSDLRINKIFAERVKLIRSRFSYRDIYNIICSIVMNMDIQYEYKRFYIEIVTLRYACIIQRKDFDKIYNEIERYV